MSGNEWLWRKLWERWKNDLHNRIISVSFRFIYNLTYGLSLYNSSPNTSSPSSITNRSTSQSTNNYYSHWRVEFLSFAVSCKHYICVCRSGQRTERKKPADINWRLLSLTVNWGSGGNSLVWPQTAPTVTRLGSWKDCKSITTVNNIKCE